MVQTMRILNKTDISVARLLVLYDQEIGSVVESTIDMIVFDVCQLRIYDINGSILLNINEK